MLLPSDERPSVVLIDHRPLVRQRLARWLQGSWQNLRITSLSDVDDLSPEESVARDANLIILSIAERPIRNRRVLGRVARLVRSSGNVPVVLLLDRDDLEGMVEAITHGVRGYILTTLEQTEVADALRFIMAGSTFVPAIAVVHWMRRRETEKLSQTKIPVFDSLTPREVEVLAHVSQGKANKVIAYELGISESTVKVFVRQILTKLSASNRTEVAYLARQQVEGLDEERRSRSGKFTSRGEPGSAGYRGPMTRPRDKLNRRLGGLPAVSKSVVRVNEH